MHRTSLMHLDHACTKHVHMFGLHHRPSHMRLALPADVMCLHKGDAPAILVAQPHYEACLAVLSSRQTKILIAVRICCTTPA